MQNTQKIIFRVCTLTPLLYKTEAVCVIGALLMQYKYSPPTLPTVL